jgi:HK97 gp10 family phage protein
LPGQLSSASQRLSSFSLAGISTGGHGYTVEVVVGAPYGRYVEFGTAFMDPEPFLRPAMRKGEDALVKEVKSRLPKHF